MECSLLALLRFLAPVSSTFLKVILQLATLHLVHFSCQLEMGVRGEISLRNLVFFDSYSRSERILKIYKSSD